jgi:hypothetical protein
MTPYARQIAQAIEYTDEATLAIVEQFMRDETGGTLDHLTTPEFAALARQAAADAVQLQAAGQLAMVCDANGLAMPPWAA